MPQQIDYTARDYAALRTFLLDQAKTALPEWTSRSPSDPGVVLVELFAYVGDILSYYGDRIANEAFLSTATQRRSLLDISAMLDYRPRSNTAARTTVTFTLTDAAVTAGVPVLIPAGTRLATKTAVADDPIYFTTDEDLTIDPGVSPTDSVAATEGLIVSDESIGVGTGAPSQAYALFDHPVVEGSVVVKVDSGSGPGTWRYYPNLVDADNDEFAYTLRTDENGVVSVIFGDDVNGAAPSIGAAITATYRKGGGAVGNVPAGTVTEMIDLVAGVGTVTNNVAAGGLDAETNDEIRVNAPKSLRSLNRAVTTEDYANLALQATSVVAKASAQADVYTAVSLYIATSGGEDDLGNTAYLDAVKALVQDYLDSRKMIGATITLLDPTYAAVDVTVSVEVAPAYSNSEMELAVENSIRGLFAFDAVDFADRITLADVYSALRMEGILYGAVTLLDLAGLTGVDDVQLAVNEIPKAGTITVNATGGVV